MEDGGQVYVKEDLSNTALADKFLTINDKDKSLNTINNTRFRLDQLTTRP